jgi:hypothetical protein
VFYNSVEVEALAVRPIRERTEGNIRPYTTTDQILGHAVAHEIGHLFLNLKSHSATGIIRGDWDLKDLQDASKAITGVGRLRAPPQQITAPDYQGTVDRPALGFQAS